MADDVQVVVGAAHRILRGVIDLACREAGVSVVDRAGTAVEIETACRSSRPDLLVMDLDLPDADGLRVLDELGPMRPPSILVLAERADGDRVLRALRLGVLGYVTKGDGLHDLAAAIGRVAAGERVMAPDLHDGAVAALGKLARRAREGESVGAGLTKRERQVLELLSEGFTVGQVATRLAISPRTVETHVAKLYRKLGVRTRLQAVSRAAALGLVDL